MFKGEKTTTFWIGLIVFGYSILQFFNAIWQIVYYPFIYPALIGASGIAAIFSYTLIETLGVTIPSIVSGIVFMIIALYIMKVGVRKNQPLTQSQNA